ncbi:MAG: SPFH domain-containing protein [Prevotellaceae bacterium]|jgi:regulator of protease activity HflC (stomatin/prohibitin superfamily)|nr:SPFH domain-containing protein [Prevotellaceae bacterium]
MKNEVNFSGLRLNGVLMMVINILILVAAILSFVFIERFKTPAIISGIVLMLIDIIGWFGFVLIEPNNSCVLVFFGKYSGTIKNNGFFFVNPFYSKKILSLRANNMDVEPIKVNDKIGNPVMIGLVLVWKIEDTYKVSFDIESEQQVVSTANNKSGISEVKKVSRYNHFVKVQSDAALRKLAGMYPYDNFDGEHETYELTLRSGGEEVNEQLEHELSERLAIAGIKVIEARINYLAYASEIAGAMLRRQQASAIIAAREKIVEGAVSMVELALNKLSENHVVELDEEKKAAMVSNLMVVLCADDNAQPVINTGTLYQ